MQNFIQSTYRDLLKNEKKLQILQKQQPISKKSPNKNPIPFKSPDKTRQIPSRGSLPTNNFHEITEKLKEIQFKNNEALNNKPRKSSPNPIDFKKQVKLLNINLPKENGFKLKLSHPSDLLLRRNLGIEAKEIKENYKKSKENIQKQSKYEKIQNFQPPKKKKTEILSNKDQESTNNTEKEEVPRDLKVVSLIKKKNSKLEFWRTFPKDLRFFSPFHSSIPEWNPKRTIENEYEKLYDMMEKTKNARNNLLDIHLSIFDIEKNVTKIIFFFFF